VIMRGNALGRSLLPLTKASRMEGWSDPTLTKQLITPA
jgi:hypothetical protein